MNTQYQKKSPQANNRSKPQNAWREEVALELAKIGYAKDADEFIDCQNAESVRFWRVCATDAAHHAAPVFHTCHKRVCPECEARNSGRLFHRYYQPIFDIVRRRRYGRGLTHMILTTPIDLRGENVGAQLRDAYAKVGEFFDILFGKDWQNDNRGYLAGCEFGERGYKLHFHILVYCEYIDQNKAWRIWTDLTGFTAMPYLKRVDHKDHSLEDALAEVVKYVTKLSTLEPALAAKVFHVIRGTRRIRSKGLFYRLPAPEKPDCACPVCKDALRLWSRERYEEWLELRRIEALADLVDTIGGSVLLRNGNNFLGILGQTTTENAAESPEKRHRKHLDPSPPDLDQLPLPIAD